MRKRIVVIMAGVVALMVIGVIIWIISMIPKHNGEVKTVNQADVVESGVLTERDLVAIEDTVNRKITAFYSDKISGGATISVRTDSVKKDGKTATALADVEDLHITYAITLDMETGTAISNCAAIEDTKYLDGFCFSGETSTASVAFGKKLPRTGSVQDGNEKKFWRMSESEYGAEGNPDGSRRPYMILETYYCDEDEKFVQSAKDWIGSLGTGLDTNMFQFKVKCGVEDLKAKKADTRPHG